MRCNQLSDVSCARRALPALSGDWFLYVNILADWLTRRRSSSLQSLLLRVRGSLRSSEHRPLVSGALAEKKWLCPDRQGWYSHFSWAPTSVIGFEKRDWWRTSLSVAWCFSPQGFSACVPRPSISLASHEPACVSCEPLCTPGEVAAAGAHQSFWSLSSLTSFFSSSSSSYLVVLMLQPETCSRLWCWRTRSAFNLPLISLEKWSGCINAQFHYSKRFCSLYWIFRAVYMVHISVS